MNPGTIGGSFGCDPGVGWVRRGRAPDPDAQHGHDRREQQHARELHDHCEGERGPAEDPAHSDDLRDLVDRRARPHTGLIGAEPEHRSE